MPLYLGIFNLQISHQKAKSSFRLDLFSLPYKIMEYTWNYSDIEPNYSIEMERSYSTKHGISRLLSFGLGGLGHVNDANRRDLAKNFKLIKRILKFTGLYIEDIKDNNFSFYLGIIRILLIAALSKFYQLPPYPHHSSASPPQS
jgi:hypothetical protein